jgi:hypothetical protein
MLGPLIQSHVTYPIRKDDIHNMYNPSNKDHIDDNQNKKKRGIEEKIFKSLSLSLHHCLHLALLSDKISVHIISRASPFLSEIK